MRSGHVKKRWRLSREHLVDIYFLYFTLFAIVSIISCIFAGVMGDSVQSAKRTILNKFRSDSSKKIALHYGRMAFVSSLISIRLEYVLGGESLWHTD